MKKIYLSPDKKLIGVCAGVADSLNIDPVIIRIAVVCLALLTIGMPVVVVYIALGFVFPSPPVNYYQLVQNTGKKLTKGTDKKVAGVCSGVAEFFGCDATVIRLILALAIIFFGFGLALYLVCWALIPDKTFTQNMP